MSIPVSHRCLPHVAIKWLLPALLTLLLAACASHAPPPSAALPALPSRLQVPTVPATLADALASLPTSLDERNVYTLGWADQCLAQARVTDAKTLLQTLRPEALTNSDRLHWVLLMAQVELAQQHPEQALTWLDNTTLAIPQLLAQAPLSVRSRMELLRADALLLQGRLVDSLQQRVSVNPLLDANSRQYNEQMIWAVLMHLPENQLQQSLATSQGDLLGWLQLANIYRDPLTNIQSQSERVDNWRTHWPHHPATLNPPQAIVVLQKATRFRPQKVAVLLPQSGPLAPAARALRDGLLSAYYHAQAPQQQAPELVFLDSSKGDIQSLYQQAVSHGAQLVLGPLDKTKVAALAALGRFTIPVITWNYTDPSTVNLPSGFYEFGLAPEDEVAQIAAEAMREGKHRAGVLYPNSDWGQRIANAFVADWQALGGSITATQAFDKDGSSAVPALLQTNASRQRERAVSRHTPLPVQFDERPRQDMDFLLLIANADQGRQIKPLLNFHFAAQLPVFALSYIYQGEDAPTKDKDLDGIRFLDLPWILNDSSLHQELTHLWPNQHGIYESLFAMGLDSYRLIDHLPLLIAAPGMRLPGQTGALSLGNDQRIQRELNWAVFSHGRAEALPIVVSGFKPAP